MSIQTRLALSVVALGVILVLTVVLTGRAVEQVQGRMQRVSHESVPTSAELAQLNSNVYATIAALRGWMLTGESRFERERESTWHLIGELTRDLDRRWRSRPDSPFISEWSRVQATLGELRRVQKQIADIAHTPEALPATQLLMETAAPLDERMYREITRIIDAEKALSATPTRKELLGIMADLRGSSAAGFAMLRTYLLTGESRFQDAYQSLARTRDARLATLGSRRALLSEEQQRAYERFVEAHEQFALLPEQLFRIRSSKRWNIAHHLLATEAIPRAESLLETLAGTRREDGFRHGGAVSTIQESLVEEALAVNADTDELRTTLWVLLSLGLGASLVIVVVIARSIVKPMAALGSVVAKLTQGDTSLEVPGTERADEIGDMARAVSTLTARLEQIAALCKKVSEGDYSSQIERRGERDSIAISVNSMVDDFQQIVAQALLISKGDYSVNITPKSDSDTLGITLAAMTRGLREMSARDRRESWLRAGQRKIAETALGHQELSDLCRNIITCLSEYIGARVGALYVQQVDSGVLTLAGSYAFNKRKHMQTEFKPGEGLVGQAALEQQRILLTDVPDDYVYVTSGLGAAPPKHILVAPLSMGQTLKGVVELGRLDGFTDVHCELLDLIADNIAIAINTAQNVAGMERLIAETKQQAEALAHQSEELQATNEELYEKSERLAHSREELQAQSEELRVSNEELMEKANFLKLQKSEIASKNRELEQARQALQKKATELEQSGRYKSEFLANMSHELRIPLNSILILAKLLADNSQGNLSPDQAESAAVIHGSGQDLLRLINDILDLSKVEAGKLDIIVEYIDLDALGNRLHKQFMPIAHQRGVHFEVERQPEVGSGLRADRVRIEQILKNLLANAFKFSDGGTVRLLVHRPPDGTQWRVPGLSRDTAIGFSVSDTGIGIAEDQQAAIFEAFQQADGSTSRKYGGTGLGLTISRALTQLLGGELHLQSKRGEGSTFTLYLPMTAANAPEVAVVPAGTDRAGRLASGDSAQPTVLSAADTPETDSHGGEQTDNDDGARSAERERLLLLIEDDATFSATLGKLARDRGYQCAMAYDGIAGLQMAAKMQPDAIILDLGLPGLDGLSVLEQLKFDLQTRHIPVHIISARERGAEGLRMGAIGHLVKPVSTDDLARIFARVERYVEKRVKSVLLVEDDDNGRDAIVKLIATDTIQITQASSGEQALAALRTHEFECMILDLGLPDTSGFELLRTLHTDRSFELPPIIVYTGRELSRDEHALLSELTSSIVVKGAISPERLLDEVLLFLHSIEDSLPPVQRSVLRDLHDSGHILHGRKILLVDDNLRNSFALAGVLKAHGVKVVIADNGQLALDRLASEIEIELIIMDIMMPVMDGYEAIRRIRAQPRWQSVPIIALTAKAMPEDRARCLDAGANDYMTKPVDTEQLLTLIRIWLFGAR